MPTASVVSNPSAVSRFAAQSFAFRSQAGSCAAWIQAAGELDFGASLKLRQTLREAQRSARLVLDLRRLTFIDISGVQVILDAARSARRTGGRVMIVRGPPQVDRLLTVAGAASEMLIFDLDADEPSAELLYAA